MLKTFLSTIFTFCFLVAIGQGIDFFNGTWTEAIDKANSEDRIIFVDAYTTWCGPCKKMAKQVFPDENVGKFFNSNFVNMKIDMESEAGRSFNKKYRVTGYPTFLFINGKGDVVHKISGFRPAAPFIEVAKVAVKKDDKSADMLADYEGGNRDYKFMLKYIKALNRSSKPSLKVANDYISSKPEISKKERADFLYEAVTESDSRLFSEMIKARKILQSMKTEPQMEKKITNACRKTVLKAIEFQSAELLKETQGIMSKYLPKKANAFNIESNMTYYEELGEIDKYLKEVKKYSSSIIDEEPLELIKMSEYLASQYRKNESAMKMAEDIARQSIKSKETVQGYMNYSQILQSNGKKGEAIKNANKALSLAKLQGEKTAVIERFVKYLESE